MPEPNAAAVRIRGADVHLWTFDPRGRVSELLHVVDTAEHVAALHARALT